MEFHVNECYGKYKFPNSRIFKISNNPDSWNLVGTRYLIEEKYGNEQLFSLFPKRSPKRSPLTLEFPFFRFLPTIAPFRTKKSH